MNRIPEDVMAWEREMRKKWLSHQTIRLHAGECTRGEVVTAEAIAGLVISDAVDAILAEREDQSQTIERLQTIIDSRPAINAGLPDSYIKWSQSIYVMEAKRAGAVPANDSRPN